MAKPVDIELLLGRELARGLDAAAHSAASLEERLEGMWSLLAERIAAQCGQVRSAVQLLGQLRRRYEELAGDAAPNELQAQIEACMRSLGEDEGALARLQDSYERNAARARALTEELSRLREATARMRLEGQQDAQPYQLMEQRAQELEHMLAGTPASGGSQLQGAHDGAGGVADQGGFVATFAAQREELEGIQTRVQSVLTVAAELRQVIGALDAARRLAPLLKMKQSLAAANGRLADALGISAGAASALLSVLTLGLSSALSGAIGLWERYADAQRLAPTGEQAATSGFGLQQGSGQAQGGADALIDYTAQAHRRLEQVRIALLREGFERERAEARSAFEQRKQRIEAEERELLALCQRLREAGVAEAPQLSGAVAAQAAAQRVQAAHTLDSALAAIDEKEQRVEAERRSATQQQLAELLARYRDFEAQRAAIVEQGEEQIAALQAQRTGANAQQIDRAVAVARAQMQEQVQSVNDAQAADVAKNNGFLQQLFGDYSSLALGKLRELMAQARQLRAYLGGEGSLEGVEFITAEQVERIRESPDHLSKLNKAIAGLLKTGSKGDGKWVEIVGTMRTGITEVANAKGFEQVAGTISTIGSAAAEATGELAALFSGLGEQDAADHLKGVQQGLQSLTNIAQGFAKEGLAGGLAALGGEAAAMLVQAFTAGARHRAALKEIERAKLDFQRRYNLALLEQNLLFEEDSTIFGEKLIAGAINSIRNYRMALALFNAQMRGEKPRMSMAEAATGDITGSYAARMGQYEQGIYGLASARIVTSHRKSGLFGWGAGKDVYGSLLEAYPGLIDAQGRLDTAMLETVLSTRKMSDQTREYLEHLLELNDALEQADKALEDYLSDTFGSLGDSLLERVREQAKGVTEVYANMRDDVSSVLEGLGEQVVYSLFFADKFEGLQNQLKSLYGSGRSESQIADDVAALLASFYAGLGADMDAAQAWMEQYRKKAEEMGYGLWTGEGTAQSGRAGALTTLTQEQGTKLEGLMTSIQIHEASIDDKLDNVAEGMGRSLDALRRIEQNTDSLPQMLALWQAVKRDGLKVK